MNFNLTEEQTLLQDSIARFVGDHYALDQRTKLVSSRHGFSEDHWQTMADLGWLALPFAEADGGLGGTPIDTMVLMEQLGKGLVVEPYLASIVLGGGALRRGANDELRAQVLQQVIAGKLQLTLAYAEEQARFDLNDVTTRANQTGDAFTINGHKSMVLHAATADKVVVSARTSGASTDTAGISLFVIDADAEGVKLDSFSTTDGLRASELTLTNVNVAPDCLIGEQDRGFEILQEVALDGILAISAEAVGAMEVLYKDTVAYTQEREQFGHALSEFQALQHRMVDMFVDYEQCKSLLYRATMERAQDSELAPRTIHALKHMVGKTGIAIAEEAVQMHGGMGMTEELRIGHYFKRLLVIDSQFGNSDYHLEQFAA